MVSTTVCVARLIGTCHGLNSPHSPRIVTSATKGVRHCATSENMLTQLPTPLDCISITPRWPPSHASQHGDAFPVLSAQWRIEGSAWIADQLRVAAVRHIGDLPHIVTLQRVENLHRPVGQGALPIIAASLPGWRFVSTLEAATSAAMAADRSAVREPGCSDPVGVEGKVRQVRLQRTTTSPLTQFVRRR